MALDERLRRELERAGRPADPSGIYEDLIRRRERRRIVRKVESGVLAIAVVAVSVAGVYGLSRVFGDNADRDAVAPTVSNGEIVFSTPLEGEGGALMAVSPDGTGLRRLTPEGRAEYGSPDVSPDGRTVVVVQSLPSFLREQFAGVATVPIELPKGVVNLNASKIRPGHPTARGSRSTETSRADPSGSTSSMWTPAILARSRERTTC